MNKIEYLNELRNRLSGIPQKDIDQTIEFYEELILDKMEEGLSEEEAVETIGPIDEVVKTILADVPISKLVKEKFKPKRKLKTWEIVVISSTAIIWVPIAITLFACLLAAYVSLWSGVISLAAVSISSAASSFIMIVGILDIVTGNAASGIFLLGLGMAFLGTALLFGLLTVKFAKVMVIVCKKIILWIKSLFVRRGEIDES